MILIMDHTQTGLGNFLGGIFDFVEDVIDFVGDVVEGAGDIVTGAADSLGVQGTGGEGETNPQTVPFLNAKAIVLFGTIGLLVWQMAK